MNVPDILQDVESAIEEMRARYVSVIGRAPLCEIAHRDDTWVITADDDAIDILRARLRAANLEFEMVEHDTTTPPSNGEVRAA